MVDAMSERALYLKSKHHLISEYTPAGSLGCVLSRLSLYPFPLLSAINFFLRLNIETLPKKEKVSVWKSYVATKPNSFI